MLNWIFSIPINAFLRCDRSFFKCDFDLWQKVFPKKNIFLWPLNYFGISISRWTTMPTFRKCFMNNYERKCFKNKCVAAIIFLLLCNNMPGEYLHTKIPSNKLFRNSLCGSKYYTTTFMLFRLEWRFHVFILFLFILRLLLVILRFVSIVNILDYNIKITS